MKYIAVTFMILGLCIAIAGSVQNAPAGVNLGGGLLILGFVVGVIYLVALFERAMEATVRSAEELGQIRAKLAAMDAKIPRPETRPSPAPAKA